MITALIAAASLLAPTYREPDPEPCRMCQCNDMYDLCVADTFRDYLDGLLDGDELIARYQSCTNWLLECQRVARFIDAIENTIPLLPGSIEFPPGWDY